MKKKLLCALLTLTMCTGLLPATALAETTVPTVPTVEDKNIYANGVPIVIEARNPSTYDTWIYYMDGDEKVDIDLNPDGMEEYTIYGGAKNGTVDSTSITMTGGMVGRIYGGGDEGSTVDGDTSISISGGYVDGMTYGGGNKGTIKGNTSVTISEGTLDDWAYGGSYDGTVEGNSSVTMTGGVVGTDTSGIYGGNWKGTVKGNTSVTITGGTVKGNVSRTIDASSVVKGNWQIVRGGTNVNGTIDAPDGSLEKTGMLTN